MCDRETTSINKAMIGFINFVVKPTIDILVNLIPQVSEYEDNIICNLKKYENALAVEKEAKEKEAETAKKEFYVIYILFFFTLFILNFKN